MAQIHEIERGRQADRHQQTRDHRPHEHDLALLAHRAAAHPGQQVKPLFLFIALRPKHASIQVSNKATTLRGNHPQIEANFRRPIEIPRIKIMTGAPAAG